MTAQEDSVETCVFSFINEGLFQNCQEFTFSEVNSNLEDFEEDNEAVNWFSGVFNEENRFGSAKCSLLETLDGIPKGKYLSKIRYSYRLARVHHIVHAVDQQYEDIMNSSPKPIPECVFPETNEYDGVFDVEVASILQENTLRVSMMNLRSELVSVTQTPPIVVSDKKPPPAPLPKKKSSAPLLHKPPPAPRQNLNHRTPSSRQTQQVSNVKPNGLQRSSSSSNIRSPSPALSTHSSTLSRARLSLLQRQQIAEQKHFKNQKLSPMNASSSKLGHESANKNSFISPSGLLTNGPLVNKQRAMFGGLARSVSRDSVRSVQSNSVKTLTTVNKKLSMSVANISSISGRKSFIPTPIKHQKVAVSLDGLDRINQREREEREWQIMLKNVTKF